MNCRFLAAKPAICSQSLGHQKACRLLDPIAALSWAQQPPSCQATLGYHQPILPSPLGSVPCNHTASSPPSCSDWVLHPSANQSLNPPDGPAPRPALLRLASHRIAFHQPARPNTPATTHFPFLPLPAHHTLHATLSRPLRALGTWPRSGPHPSSSSLTTLPRAPSEDQQQAGPPVTETPTFSASRRDRPRNGPGRHPTTIPILYQATRGTACRPQSKYQWSQSPTLWPSCSSTTTSSTRPSLTSSSRNQVR